MERENTKLTAFFAFWIVLEQGEYRLDDRFLVFEPALVAQHAAQEGEEDPVLPGEL